MMPATDYSRWDKLCLSDDEEEPKPSPQPRTSTTTKPTALATIAPPNPAPHFTHELFSLSPQAGLGRVAIASTMKDVSQRIDSWVRWHVWIGFERLYLFFDDAAEADSMVLARAAGGDAVRAIPRDANLRASWALQPSWVGHASLVDKEVRAALESKCSPPSEDLLLKSQPRRDARGLAASIIELVARLNACSACRPLRFLAPLLNALSVHTPQVQVRQGLNVQYAMQLARREGIVWLLNIDSDELFLPERPAAAAIDSTPTAPLNADAATLQGAVPALFEALAATGVEAFNFMNHEVVPETVVPLDTTRAANSKARGDPFTSLSLFKLSEPAVPRTAESKAIIDGWKVRQHAMYHAPCTLAPTQP